MPKTYNCQECGEPMESIATDNENKTVWYCKKCDTYCRVEIPFKYIANED